MYPKPEKVAVVTHYYETDLAYEHDYVWIEVIIDEKQAVRYEDDYHEKGQEKTEGWVEALQFIYGKDLHLKHYSVADVKEPED